MFGNCSQHNPVLYCMTTLATFLEKSQKHAKNMPHQLSDLAMLQPLKPFVMSKKLIFSHLTPNT